MKFLTGLLCLTVTLASSAAALHPVVLIPGLTSSRLQYSVDVTVPGSPSSCPPTNNAPLWIPLFNYTDPGSMDCWLKSVSLNYDLPTRKSNNAPGVSVKTTPFGELDGVEWVTPPEKRIETSAYYKNLVDALVKLGYERNKDIRAAQYDWRYAPNENPEWLINLKNEIEQLYNTNDQKSVILIVHSMGSVMSYTFLNQMEGWWKEKYIRSWFLMASVLGGSFGTQYTYFNDRDPAQLFPQTREAGRTYPSVPFLLPRVAAFGQEVLIKSADAEYVAEDYGKFFNDLGFPHAYEQWKDTRDIYDADNITSPGNFSIYCVAGFGVATIEGAVFDGPLSHLSDNTSFKALLGDGDKAVNAKSLRLCYQLGQGKQNFASKEFAGIDHDQIIRDAVPIDYLIGIITSINNDLEVFGDSGTSPIRGLDPMVTFMMALGIMYKYYGRSEDM